MAELLTWKQLGQAIARMTPAQASKPVLTFDDGVGEYIPFAGLLTDDKDMPSQPAPPNSPVLDKTGEYYEEGDWK